MPTGHKMLKTLISTKICTIAMVDKIQQTSKEKQINRTSTLSTDQCNSIMNVKIIRKIINRKKKKIKDSFFYL